MSEEQAAQIIQLLTEIRDALKPVAVRATDPKSLKNLL